MSAPPEGGPRYARAVTVSRARWVLALAPLLLVDQAAADAGVYAQIDALAAVAAAISIDGNGADWGAIPTFADPVGDAGANPGEDITGLAIAPRGDALLLRIDTAGPPPATGRVFWVVFDFAGQQHLDVKISFNLDYTDDLDVFPEGVAAPPRVGWEGATVAVGAVLEARIPYAALDAQLPASMQGKLSGAGARPFVRVKVTSGEPFFGEIDHGPAAGSYRLVATPYPLDTALPAGSENPVETRLPLAGIWYLGQGSHGFGSHSGIPWAYDLHRVDNALLPESPPGSSDNADNLSFGEPIRAPVAGTVFSLKNDQIDHPAYSGPAPVPPNWIFLEIPGSVGLLFSHTRMGSIPFQALDAVSTQALIGEVGNSGSSYSFPHLHYEAQNIAGGFASVPIALRDVEVGLNPIDADPWLRRVSSWGAREGYFVRDAPPAVPVFGPLALAGLATLLAGIGLARARSRS